MSNVTWIANTGNMPRNLKETDLVTVQYWNGKTEAMRAGQVVWRLEYWNPVLSWSRWLRKEERENPHSQRIADMFNSWPEWKKKALLEAFGLEHPKQKQPRCPECDGTVIPWATDSPLEVDELPGFICRDCRETWTRRQWFSARSKGKELVSRVKKFRDELKAKSEQPKRLECWLRVHEQNDAYGNLERFVYSLATKGEEGAKLFRECEEEG